MLLKDTTTLTNRLSRDAAAYSDILIELWLPWAEKKVYALTDDASNGFAAVVTYPGGGVSVTVDAGCAKVAGELVSMIGPAASAGFKVTSEQIAGEFAAELGFAVSPCSDSVIHYSTDTEHFKPSRGDTGSIRKLGAQEVHRIHSFVEGEEKLRGESQRFAGLQDRLSASEAIVYICEHGGKVKGYIEIAEATHLAPLWEVDYVYTTPKSRKRGIGKQLISAVTADAVSAGLIPLYTADAENTPSTRACESVGYYVCLKRWNVAPRSG